jgi:hypothetical protein
MYSVHTFGYTYPRKQQMNNHVKAILAYLTLNFIFFKILKMKFEIQGG